MVDFVNEEDLITIDPKIKEQWVADLRSGNYKQTAGRLHDERGYCCLGVLCEQAVEAGVVTAREEEKLDGRFLMTYKDVSGKDSFVTSSLPYDIIDWANVKDARGLGSTYGKLPFRTRSNSIAYLDDLNDDGMPFNQIADIIEFWY